jgi:hypothetical protein
MAHSRPFKTRPSQTSHPFLISQAFFRIIFRHPDIHSSGVSISSSVGDFARYRDALPQLVYRGAILNKDRDIHDNQT